MVSPSIVPRLLWKVPIHGSSLPHPFAQGHRKHRASLFYAKHCDTTWSKSQACHSVTHLLASAHEFFTLFEWSHLGSSGKMPTLCPVHAQCSRKCWFDFQQERAHIFNFRTLSGSFPYFLPLTSYWYPSNQSWYRPGEKLCLGVSFASRTISKEGSKDRGDRGPSIGLSDLGVQWVTEAAWSNGRCHVSLRSSVFFCWRWLFENLFSAH